ncbi:hypothetical protein GYMLUDRAFT_42811 [Collybiopsis luxurians FD-317 M1]|uniref:Protein-S-isoprenylcysteine O-methyltransferase n=1 Tax=Collybiopsis luxurians FD-317 M1 TaxID=944289 RepID=A0A0D0CZ38_9AGAR|nr:hypothetical protein GYMLUDRAFT_42811 [Collybiopsis luxurians FD-317 M1]
MIHHPTFWIFSILSTLVISHKGLTPPNPPSTHLREYPNWLERTLIFQKLSLPFFFQKSVVWLVGGAEITVILFRDLLPRSRYSKPTLALLCGESNREEFIETFDAYFVLGSFLITVGGTLRWWCYRVLGRLFTFEVSVQKDHKLITTGPYRIIRHPSYTGMLMLCAGVLIWQGGPHSWTRQSGVLDSYGGKAIAIAYIVWSIALMYASIIRTKTEDSILSNEFGDQWKQWADKVPYLLLPYFF